MFRIWMMHFSLIFVYLHMAFGQSVEALEPSIEALGPPLWGTAPALTVGAASPSIHCLIGEEAGGDVCGVAHAFRTKQRALLAFTVVDVCFSYVFLALTSSLAFINWRLSTTVCAFVCVCVCVCVYVCSCQCVGQHRTSKRRCVCSY